MSNAEATVLAALIAAVVSLASAALSYGSAKAIDSKATHRGLIGQALNEIGALIYELVALSKKMTDMRTDENFSSVRGKADSAAHRLDELRRNHRYALWGVDDGFRTIKWMPIYVAHHKNERQSKRTKEIILLGTKLRRAMDSAIAKSYYTGRPPTLAARLHVKYRAWRLRKFFDDGGPLEESVTQQEAPADR